MNRLSRSRTWWLCRLPFLHHWGACGKTTPSGIGRRDVAPAQPRTDVVVASRVPLLSQAVAKYIAKGYWTKTGREPCHRRQLCGQARLPLLAATRRGCSGRRPPENMDRLAARVVQAEDAWFWFVDFPNIAHLAFMYTLIRSPRPLSRLKNYRHYVSTCSCYCQF